MALVKISDFGTSTGSRKSLILLIRGGANRRLVLTIGNLSPSVNVHRDKLLDDTFLICIWGGLPGLQGKLESVLRS